jgi:SNF2 family DNA or RNA helicase
MAESRDVSFYCGKNQLVFEAPDPIAVRSVLPHAKTLNYKGRPHVVVKHDLDAVTILRNIGIEAPSPVNHGWEYPGQYKPFEHQRASVEFLTVHRRAFNLSEMGVGKTAAALWAAEYLITQGVVHRVLIVCPKSCTHKVWEDELFRTLMHRTAVVVEGGREKKLALAASDSEFLIVNHDGLATIHDVVAKDSRIDLIIYDEAGVLRNGQIQRYKTLKSLLKPATRLWLLTATPCPNAPTDAWALARLVRPETVPPYFTSFKRQTMIQVSNFKWVPKPESTKMAYDALQPAIRFKTSDCHDLPPITYQNRSVELSPEQAKMLKAMAKDFVAEKDGATITAANAAVKMVKALQILGGVCYDDTGTPVLIDAPDRLATVREIIEEADHKVIIWCPFKHVMEHLRQHISSWFNESGAAKGDGTAFGNLLLGTVSQNVAVINGDVGNSARTDIITRFQNTSDPLKVLIAHPATAAHGLTLTAANICVWYGPTFSADIWSQANARVNRPGQKHHMTVVKLGSTALEWEAYGVAEAKVGRQEKILTLYRKMLDSPV